MKVNKVYKVIRPMRKFGNLLKDIFSPQTSTHWWIRVSEVAYSQQEKKEIINIIIEKLNNRIKVYENN
jgi:hypothetical protein